MKKSREHINQQKIRIEKIRRDAAMLNVSDVHGSKENAGIPLPEELNCLSIIEDNKRVYKKSFQRLRELKGTIEHIKQLLLFR